MQYDVRSPQEYFDALSDDWRKDRLLALRKMILDYAPELNEMIQYKMLAFGSNEQEIVISLNAQKSFVALYVGNISKIEGSELLLAEFDCGKGCIRIKKKNDIYVTGLQAFIHKFIDHWRQGLDVSC